jgi:phosphoribosylglycinamide formyltransferase 1
MVYSRNRRVRRGLGRGRVALTKVGILISGRGSNMVALLDAMDRGEVPAQCCLVLSNKAEAPGLETARRRGIATTVIDHKTSATREEHDGKVVAALQDAGAEFVCLAGYMRLLSPVLVGAFRNRILNIHPALLPAFPGLHVQQKALDAGVRYSGCTVHIVDEEMDHGAIVLQAVVPVMPGDDEESLSKRILAFEHRLYPAALRLMCEGKVAVNGPKAELNLPAEEYRTLLGQIIWSGDPR